MRYTLIDGEQYFITSGFCGLQLLPILPAFEEARPLGRMGIMVLRSCRRSSGKHSSSSTFMQFGQKGFFRFLKCLNSHFARD